MKRQLNGDGTVRIEPLPKAVQVVIAEWQRDHIADLDARLEPFGLSSSLILKPSYERIFLEPEDADS